MVQKTLVLDCTLRWEGHFWPTIHVLSLALTSELWTLKVEGIQWIGVDYFGCTLPTVGHIFCSLAFVFLR